MKYTPPYRFDGCGGVFEYDEEQQAYIHIGRQSQLSKEELKHYRFENAMYERRYDNYHGKNKNA